MVQNSQDNYTTVAENSPLVRELSRQYPAGLPVTLAKESLYNLGRYERGSVQPWETLRGIIDGRGSRPGGSHGQLDARLVLPPALYHLLKPLRNGDGASLHDVLLAGGRFQGVEVQLPMTDRLLDHMFIEDIPYRDAMDMAYEYEPADDRSLKLGLMTRFVQQQPGWLKEIANVQTFARQEAYFEEKVQPVYRQFASKVSEVKRQVYAEQGFNNEEDFRLASLQKNPSEELAVRVRNVQQRKSQLLEQHKTRLEETFREFDLMKVSLQKDCIQKFHAQAMRIVSDVEIIRRAGDKMAIRCKLDGQQQLGRTLSKADTAMVQEVMADTAKLKILAERYFNKEILDTMFRQQSEGLKR